MRTAMQQNTRVAHDTKVTLLTLRLGESAENIAVLEYESSNGNQRREEV